MLMLAMVTALACAGSPAGETLPLDAHVHIQMTSQPQSQPQRTPDDPDSDLTETLRDIDRKAEHVKDLQADFRQSKHTALLKRPMQSEGTVRIKADASHPVVRWDTTKPSAATTLITIDQLKIHTPGQSLLEIYPVVEGWSQLAASPLPRFEALRKHFAITRWSWTDLDPNLADKRLALRLVPEDELREHVLEARILIDRETGCVVEAEVIYPDHDRLGLKFTNIRLNKGIELDELELKVPAGTTISRPLEAKEKADS